MSTERQPNPGENEVERDFSIPEDADYTTPGEPIEDGRHDVEKDVDDQNATPGNPLGGGV